MVKRCPKCGATLVRQLSLSNCDELTQEFVCIVCNYMSKSRSK